MSPVLGTPDTVQLAEAVHALRGWQGEESAFQLHSGDLGWAWRLGPATLAAHVRTWRREGRIVALGVFDDHALVRLTIAPDVRRDEALAQRLAEDLGDPGRGLLGTGEIAAEVPADALLHDLLSDAGWGSGESWTPLRRDLAAPVEDPGLPIVVVGPDQVSDRVAVQRASFPGSTFSEERWRTMAAGPAYADARCLLGYDEQGTAVAAVTVWSAGGGRPGLLEPMGVHRDHRGRGHGRAITVAAAAALREMGSSSATVATRSANVGGVATYRAAGYVALPERLDRSREALSPG